MFLLASLVQNVWRSVCGVICGKQEHEPKRFTVYHGAFKYQYHNELVRSCVHRYRKIRGSASNRIEVFTTILTTFDSENIKR